MKKTTRLSFLLLAGLMTLSTVACGGGGNSSSAGAGESSSITASDSESSSNTSTNLPKTEVRVNAREAGYGTDWIKDAEIEFERRFADKEYEPGKKGVDLKIEYTKSQGCASMKSSGDVIYISTQGFSGRELAVIGSSRDITDWVTEKYDERDGVKLSIADKIDPAYQPALSHIPGTYYALPGQNSTQGLSYDKELFDSKGYYIADPSETNVEEHKAYGRTVRFIKNKNGKKSIGADGVYGTYDDGLPTALTELIVLCDLLASSKKGGKVTPFEMTGAQPEYMSYMSRGLGYSLAGPHGVRSLLDFTGEFEYVESFSKTKGDYILDGIDYIQRPIVKTVNITEEPNKQYLLTQTAARFYQNAFVDIIYNEGWLHKDATTKTVSHIQAQGNFLMSGQLGVSKTAFFIDGSYWYTEAVQNNKMQEYTELTGNETRDVAWMPLPVNFDDPIFTADKAAKRVMVNEANTDFIVINAREKNEGKLKVCKDFIQMIYSDEWLSYYSGSTGATRTAMNYEIKDEDMAKLSTFHYSVMNMANDTEHVTWTNLTTENARYMTNVKTFREMFSWPNVGGVEYSAGPFPAVRAGHHAQAIFESLFWSEADWSGLAEMS